jgi:hypothetical protein
LGQDLVSIDRALGCPKVMMCETTWDKLAGLSANPFAEEFRAHLDCRTKYSHG